MNLTEYKQGVVRTLNRLNSIELDLSHLILGVFSEINEFLEAEDNNDEVNMKEEIGDIAFYATGFAIVFGIDTSNIDLSKNKVDIELTESLDVIKKHIAYGKHPGYQYYYNLYLGLMSHLYELCEDKKFDLYEILNTNIEKLKVRYPDKFTNHNAINRNLKAEKEVLSKNSNG